MKKTLYHGSEKIIERPVFGQGKPYNDYGLGFYCTENLDLAKEWATRRDRDGFANHYQIEEDGLKILSLSAPRFNLLHWLAILLENRTFDLSLPLARAGKDYLLREFAVPYRKYDVLIGYRADDSYFAFAQDFLGGVISLRQLNEAMHLGKLGEQYVLLSKKAFAALKYIDVEGADRREWFLKRQRRDDLARAAYRDMDKNAWQKGDLFITHILEEEIKADDDRLQ